MTTNKLWLPEGHHWGLNIKHEHVTQGAGQLDHGAGPKLCWHTAEMIGAEATARVLANEGFPVHFVIDPSAGDSVVIQMMALDRTAEGLEHPGGTPETNAANVVQVEIADYARHAPMWDHNFYRDLAALACLIDHRTKIPRHAPKHFGTVPSRFSPAGWIQAKGHVGHQHAPNQRAGHWDPGALNWAALSGQMVIVEHHYG